ncbi:TRAP transporter small permease [Blastococcus brunescens]|uniref:TRAP transporter small permease n=1 Tax=Blastococcus brunescens TaxID=1564165 RepID=A0ABZ1B3V1_9ACTN|nr:TRAP transporter small permease [Blastococcus sp. BMG 8361]WRL65414.1 TRAP transporter small permease [Blastococcus sp. BMG 8361]
MEKLAKAVAVPLGILASVSTMVMLIAIAADVIYRNLTDRSIPGVLELSETALVATVFLGLAYAGVSGAHIGVDLLVTRLPKATAKWTLVTAGILSIGTIGWLLLATLERAVDSVQRGETRTGLLSWPLWPARWIIAIGLCSWLIVVIANVVRLLRGQDQLGAEGEGL